MGRPSGPGGGGWQSPAAAEHGHADRLARLGSPDCVQAGADAVGLVGAFLLGRLGKKGADASFDFVYSKATGTAGLVIDIRERDAVGGFLSGLETFTAPAGYIPGVGNVVTTTVGVANSLSSGYHCLRS